MAEDPYDILGVSRRASDEEIRRAFRKLAKEHHPDVNPDKRRRGAVQEGHGGATTSSAIRKSGEQYDRGEIDAAASRAGRLTRQARAAARAGARGPAARIR